MDESQEIERLKRLLFLKTGWGRVLARSKEMHDNLTLLARYRKDDGFETRSNGNWNILNGSDPWALQYRRLRFRLKRAERAFLPQPQEFKLTGDGPHTLVVGGVRLSGFAETPHDEMAARQALGFQATIRASATVAKRALGPGAPSPADALDARITEGEMRAIGQGVH